jgi:hypothetical protein
LIGRRGSNEIIDLISPISHHISTSPFSNMIKIFFVILAEATATTKDVVAVREEDKSVSAVTWDSNPTELQAKLAATEEKLRRMEEMLAKAKVHSAVLSELDPEEPFVTPPSTKARKTDRTALAGAPTGAGGDD